MITDRFRTGRVGEGKTKMSRTARQPHRAASIAGRSAIHTRRPAKAACLALITASVYGFWWWYDFNRRLRALGQPARPWRALGEVVLGLLVVAPAVMAGWPWLVVAVAPVAVGLCLLSVWQTGTLLAAAQRERAVRPTVDPRLAAGIAAAACAGAVAWYAMAALQMAGFLLVGVLWPMVAMCFVGYLQAQLNTVAGGSR